MRRKMAAKIFSDFVKFRHDEILMALNIFLCPIEKCRCLWYNAHTDKFRHDENEVRLQFRHDERHKRDET